MSLVYTYFYGDIENLKRLENDINYCMSNGFTLTPLLKKNGFDPEVFNKSTKGRNIDSEIWETLPCACYMKNDCLRMSFENWDRDIDFRVLNLVSLMYNVNYYSYDNVYTGNSEYIKSSNTYFKDRDFKVITTEKEIFNDCARTINLGNCSHQESCSHEIFGDQKKISSYIDYLNQNNIQYSCSDMKDYSHKQIINGVYYEQS